MGTGSWRTIVRAVLMVASAFVGITQTWARCDLSRVVGFTLIAKKTVVAYIEDGKRVDGFNGCNFDRVLVFEDNTGLRCDGYNYAYAYMPDAYLFAASTSIKGCIEDEWYDLSWLR
jgi:hypothetical protein